MQHNTAVTMKKLLTILLLSQFLMTCAYGMSSVKSCFNVSWSNATERIDDSPLKQSEIAYTYLFMDNAVYKSNGFDTTKFPPSVKSTAWFGFSCPKCIQGIHVDIDGRESDKSVCL